MKSKLMAGLSVFILLTMPCCFQTEGQGDQTSTSPPASNQQHANPKPRSLENPEPGVSPEHEGHEARPSTSPAIYNPPPPPPPLPEPERGSSATLKANRIGRGRWTERITVWDRPGEINTKAEKVAVFDKGTKVELLGEMETIRGFTYYKVKVGQTEGWVNLLFVDFED